MVESGPPPSVLEAVGQLCRLGLATPWGPLSGYCLPPRAPRSHATEELNKPQGNHGLCKESPEMDIFRT